MNKTIKYLLCLRADSPNVLKLLIVFNVILSLYLLFIYGAGVQNEHQIPIQRRPLPYRMNNRLSDDSLVRNEKNGQPTFLLKSDISAIAQLANDENNNKLNDDSELETGNDSSYKHVEDDDKTVPDDVELMRIQALGKSDHKTNIIISDEADKASHKKVTDQRTIKKNEDINKDVINRILESNFHVNKNHSKLIIPDSINGDNVWWTSEIRGKYNVLRDYIQAIRSVPLDGKSVTLTTQGTPEFFYHVVELCQRWDGFVSVAVYVPGDDFKLAVNMIYYLRQCSDKCVADQVHWHMVFDTLFSSGNVSMPTTYLETQSFDCSIAMDETMRLFNIKTTFRKIKKLPYPINVLRNVARISSKTEYVFASDIELYPSVGVVPAFFDLLEREKQGLIAGLDSSHPHVYVFPIFEVKESVKPPRTKAELIDLFKKGDAIFFHRFVCDDCQHFPDRDIWIQSVPQNSSLNVFRITRRTRTKSQWEPLYIGTNKDPFYDERLTWDGKRDKMTQMYEMCLMKYDLLILDNAFLVHTPGIKYYHSKDDASRLIFMQANQKVHNTLMAQLRKKFGPNNC